MKQRYTNLDLLRILASFMVVVLHTASMGFSSSVHSFSWAVFNFSDAAMRSSVPLFLMMSGMLIMSREECSVRRLLTKSIPRLFLIFFLWSTLYAIDAIGPGNLIRSFNLKDFLKEVWNIDQNAPHLWYLPVFIGVYFLTPVLHAIRDKKKILIYISVMFIVFAVLRATLAAFPQTLFGAKFLAKFGDSFADYAGYFILGYLLSCYRDKIKVSSTVLLIAMAIVVAIAGLIVQLLSMSQGVPQIGLYDNLTIFTYLEACILFVLFLRIPSEKIDATWNKSGWLQRVSKYTLFVYLLHPFVLAHLKSNLGICVTSANALITVPTISLGVFAVCMVLAFLIDLIPGVRKILL